MMKLVQRILRQSSMHYVDVSNISDDNHRGNGDAILKDKSPKKLQRLYFLLSLSQPCHRAAWLVFDSIAKISQFRLINPNSKLLTVKRFKTEFEEPDSKPSFLVTTCFKKRYLLCNLFKDKACPSPKCLWFCQMLG